MLDNYLIMLLLVVVVSHAIVAFIKRFSAIFYHELVDFGDGFQAIAEWRPIKSGN
jgi:hypothetical protein